MGTCQISGGHHGQHQRPGTWSSSCWHGALIFHTSLPCLELGDTLLLGVHNEHQVISVEKLPWYTSAELPRKCFQYQNEEQWAKDKTLMHTNSHTKLLTVLTIDLHTTLCIWVHALDDTHSPFLNTWGSLRLTIGPSLALNRRLSQGRWRQSRVISQLQCTSPAAGEQQR